VVVERINHSATFVLYYDSPREPPGDYGGHGKDRPPPDYNLPSVIQALIDTASIEAMVIERRRKAAIDDLRARIDAMRSHPGGEAAAEAVHAALDRAVWLEYPRPDPFGRGDD